MSLWIKNARIATMDDTCPSASSCLVIGEYFAYVGDEAGAEDYLRLHPQEDLQVIDCGGHFLMPGFDDSHMHYLHYVKTKLSADLTGVTSFRGMLEEMRRFFRENYDPASGLWLTGEGWNQDYFTDEKRFPTCRDLDTVTTEYPILVMRCCYHIGVMNSKAMELLGIDRETVKKYGVYAETFPDGTPNGIIKEGVFDDIKQMLPAPAPKELVHQMIEMQRDLFAKGIVSVQSDDYKYCPAGHAYEMMSLLRESADCGDLKVRYAEQALLPTMSELKEFFDAYGWNDSFGNRSFKISAVKILADGSLGARTALMRKPYADDPSTCGLALYTQEELDALVLECHRHNMAAIIHAIGDGAIEMCLRAIERARREMPYLHPRHGIVHCQVTDADQLRRFRELDVCAYVQPIFIDYDMHIVFDRVGKELADTSYAWKTYLESGVHTSFGTDCPVERFDPLRGIYCAVTGKDLKGNGPAWPQQILSRLQALRAYSTNGAYHTFDENCRGRIASGLSADFITLDTDLLSCPDSDILSANVTRTFIRGNNVYTR